MLQDYLESLAINGVLTAIKLSVKNPETKARLRAAFLKIYVNIETLFLDDPTFARQAKSARKS